MNLEPPSCSCGYFDEFGIPGRHICAAAIHIGNNPKTLVVPQLHAGALKETYMGHIVPVDLNGLTDDGTKAPIKTRGRGRPNERRIPSQIEKRPKRTVVCGKCHRPGHNSRTCKAAKEKDESVQSDHLGSDGVVYIERRVCSTVL